MSDGGHYKSTYTDHFVDHSSKERNSKQFPHNARTSQGRGDQGHPDSFLEKSSSKDKKVLAKASSGYADKDPSDTRLMNAETAALKQSTRHTVISETKDISTLQEKGTGAQVDGESSRSKRANKLHHPNDLRPDIPDRFGNKLEEQIEQIKATIYGQCIGDAIGLLTEFMSKKDAKKYYAKFRNLEYSHKVHDRHRDRWDVGDWTDDSDHMILIMQSLTDMKGQVDSNDFAKKLFDWSKEGFTALKDTGGVGIGRTTHRILSQPNFKSHPEQTSKDVWVKRGSIDAPNGGVMRTSILGIHEWWNEKAVEENAAAICRTTHYDPRCQASAVAVSVTISLMLQRQKQHFDDIQKKYNVDKIINDAYDIASGYLSKKEEQEELRECMSCNDLAKLNLDDEDMMGYTFKCLGAGFWAFKQERFESAIHKLLMEGGDSDTNCAVAGALLGCKLRNRGALPRPWLSKLANQKWLEEQIDAYLVVHRAIYRDALNNQRSRHTVGSTYL